MGIASRKLSQIKFLITEKEVDVTLVVAKILNILLNVATVINSSAKLIAKQSKLRKTAVCVAQGR